MNSEERILLLNERMIKDESARRRFTQYQFLLGIKGSEWDRKFNVMFDPERWAACEDHKIFDVFCISCYAMTVRRMNQLLDEKQKTIDMLKDGSRDTTIENY